MPLVQQLSRRERKKQSTREALLAVALDIVARRGIYVTTVEDVTSRADVGKGTFYQYFSSKEDLLEHLLKDGLQKLTRLCKSYLGAAKDAKQAVRSMTRAHVEFLTDQETYLLLFHQVRGFLQLKNPMSANLRKIYARYLLDVGELLSPFLKHVSDASEKSREAAIFLAAYSTGLATHYHLFGKNLNLPIDKNEMEEKISEAIWPNKNN